ncbi:MAG: LysM peptidoglycan-binding domain-containing protein, partial [Desulfuromonas sp.]|nr:LysM peptidoglycan-binding domain-containing protein [Desulfuromonas sp.]
MPIRAVGGRPRLARGIAAMRSAWLIALFCLVIAACAPPGIYHVVEPGQTLYRIAKAYGVDDATLAKVNKVSDPTRLEAGQRLYIPGAMLTRQIPVDPPKA